MSACDLWKLEEARDSPLELPEGGVGFELNHLTPRP